MPADLRLPPAPIRFSITKPHKLFSFGAACLKAAPKAFSANPSIDMLALHSDTERTLARLEISDPFAESAVVNPFPSPAALNLAETIYPNGLRLLERTMEEESVRRRSAENHLITVQIFWCHLGLISTILLGFAFIFAFIWTIDFMVTNLSNVTFLLSLPFMFALVLYGTYRYFKFHAGNAAGAIYPEVHTQGSTTPLGRTIISVNLPSTDPHTSTVSTRLWV